MCHHKPTFKAFCVASSIFKRNDSMRCLKCKQFVTPSRKGIILGKVLDVCRYICVMISLILIAYMNVIHQMLWALGIAFAGALLLCFFHLLLYICYKQMLSNNNFQYARNETDV